MNANDAMFRFLANESHVDSDGRGKKSNHATSGRKEQPTNNANGTKGYYDDEWLEEALTGAGITFNKVAKRGVTYFNVTCPNEGEHTSDSPKSSTACWIYKGHPVFKCQHSHCSEWKWRDFAAKMGIKYDRSSRHLEEYDAGDGTTVLLEVGFDKYYNVFILNNRYNVRQLVEHMPETRNKTGYNELTRLIEVDGECYDPKLLGADLRERIGIAYDIEPGGKLNDAIVACARRNSYNPVIDYFESLPKWDGVDRIGSILHDMMGSEDTMLAREMGLLFMRAMVARVYQPGIKFDLMLILSGDQGIGKSRFFEYIAPPNQHKEIMSIDDGKDSLIEIDTCVVAEMAELEAFRKSSSMEKLKAFVTRTADHFRMPYATTSQEFPRHCVFCGDTNSPAFLNDNTGQRRWVPIKCGVTRPTPMETWQDDKLIPWRQQVHAQSLALYKSEPNKPLILPKDVNDELRRAQSHYEIVDDRIGTIENWLMGKAATSDGTTRVCVYNVCEEALGMERKEFQGNRALSNQIVEIMTSRLGCVRNDTKEYFRDRCNHPIGRQVTFTYVMGDSD